MGMFNRCVKTDYKFSTVCEKNEKMSGHLGGDFFDSHCSSHNMCKMSNTRQNARVQTFA